MTQLEAQVGRRLDIVNHFYTYNQAVGTQGEAQDIASGQMPMLTRGATSTTSINSGSQDAYITAQAVRLRDLGKPLFLRYSHEPEGTYRSSIIASPADYVSAWMHARRLFAAAGATNVVWVLCQTTFAFRRAATFQPTAYYPGDANVDKIPADGYNFAPTSRAPSGPASGRCSSPSTPGPQLSRADDGPECGAMEDPGQPSRRAGWYTDMRTAV